MTHVDKGEWTMAARAWGLVLILSPRPRASYVLLSLGDHRVCSRKGLTSGAGGIAMLWPIRRPQFSVFGFARFLLTGCPLLTANCASGEGANSSRNRSLALYSWDFELPTVQLSISAIS